MVLATYREKESRMIPSQTADEKQLTTAISVVIHTYYQDVILGPLDLASRPAMSESAVCFF